MTDTEPRNANRQSLLLPVLLPVGILTAIGVVLFGFSRVLLGVSQHAATAVALVTAASVLGVATYVAGRPRLSNAALFPMVGTIAGISLMAGGIALVAVGPSGGEEIPATTVALVAPSDASSSGFQETKLSFTTNVPTDLDFDNQETGVAHNVVIFQGPDDKAPQVFSGPLLTGPGKTTYKVPALAAGTYFFHCEVHPTTMTGTITVSDTGGGGSQLAIKAQNLAFDTQELKAPADTATTLAFDNEDAGTAHNFALFKDQGYTQNIFTGDLVTGPATQPYNLPALPAGTYYFRCDVHPATMQGTYIVGGPAGNPGAGSGGGGSGSASPSPSSSTSSSP